MGMRTVEQIEQWCNGIEEQMDSLRGCACNSEQHGSAGDLPWAREQ